MKKYKLSEILHLNRRRKRTTFLRIFAKAAAVMLIVSAVFANCFERYIRMSIYEQADREIARTQSSALQRISEAEKNGNPNSADAILPLSSFFFLEQPFFYVESYLPTNENAAVSVVLDKDGNEIASSKFKFTAVLKFGKPDRDNDIKYPENGWYTCKADEREVPDLKAFYDKFLYADNAYDLSIGINNERVKFKMKSAYVNKAEHLLIPHEITAEYIKTIVTDDVYEAELDDELIKTEEYTINADIEGYELVEFIEGSENEYPRVILPSFQGTKPDAFDEFWEAVGEEAKNTAPDVYSKLRFYDSYKTLRDKGHGRIYIMNTEFDYNGEKCILCTIFAFRIWTKMNKMLFAAITACFTAAMLILALLYSWRKNVMNKADYAFEDYQKALTNNLAHDIKTPLAAIGGYAENLLESEGDEKKQKYLRSIIENVAYTDSMISKTLELNASSMNMPEKTNINLYDLAESSIEKYRFDLEERGITITVNGEMLVEADKDMMASAIENLVSNAVKYTNDGGLIKITMNKREFNITNSVTEKTDTKDLTKPFVRGDKSRSGKNGSGLGLSIAERILESNGFSLKLKCTDNAFTAMIVR